MAGRSERCPQRTCRQRTCPQGPHTPSSIRRIERDIPGDLALPTVAVREQPLLVVIEFLAGLGGELEIRPLDNGLDRTGFLAEAAIDALDHVDVVTRGAARAVIAPRPRLDGDGLRW